MECSNGNVRLFGGSVYMHVHVCAKKNIVNATYVYNACTMLSLHVVAMTCAHVHAHVGMHA